MSDDKEVVRCKLRTNLRPLKLAYLIEDGDFDALRHVIEFACTDWGGMRNFIVPVGRDGTIKRAFGAFLKPHPPDFYLHYLHDSTEYDAFSRAKESLTALLGHQGNPTIFTGHEMESDLGAHPLSVVPDGTVDSPTRVRAFGDFSQKLTVFSFPKDEDYLYLLALFGAIYDGQAKDYAANCLINECPISLEDPRFWPEQVISDASHSPLELTTCAIVPTQVQGSFPTNLPYVLVLAKDCFSLAWFWNFRAIRDATQFDRVGRRTILVPPRLANDATAISNLMSFIRANAHVEAETSNIDFLVVYFDQPDRDRFAEILGSMSRVEEVAEGFSTEMWFGKSDKRPREADPNRVLTYHFGPVALPVSFTEGFATARGERSVSLRYGADEVEFEPPAKFVNRFNSNTVIDLQSSIWDRYPRSAATAKAIMPHSWWTHYGLSFRAVASTRATYFPIFMPSQWDAYALYLGIPGSKWLHRAAPDGFSEAGQGK